MYILLMNLCIPGSFNRYMVECELFNITTTVTFRTGFNRYMVECE